MIPVLLLFLACDFSASTKLRGADSGLDTGGEEGADGEGDGASGDDGGSSDEDPDPATLDDDGDGFSEEEGDCDDTDPAVAPELADLCDGLDNDCDLETDEDAWQEDDWEPNDEDPAELGSIESDPTWSIEATLDSDGDVDRYLLSFEDHSLSLFRLDVGLSGIPDGAAYRLTVQNLALGETYVDEVEGGAISARINDTILKDEGGDWEITVSAISGADCGRRYLLSLDYGD